MRSQTATKIAIGAVVVILFAGIILRAAMKLAATAMHSLLFAVVLVIVVAWLFVKTK
jgi:hypothetical protein